MFPSYETHYCYPLFFISQSRQNYTQDTYQNFLPIELYKLLRREKKDQAGFSLTDSSTYSLGSLLPTYERIITPQGSQDKEEKPIQR
jgi:hypothetical protein